MSNEIELTCEANTEFDVMHTSHRSLAHKDRFIMDYIGDCIYIMTTVLIGDITTRFYKAMRELIYYKNYYRPNALVSEILGRSFTYPPKAIVLMVITLLVALLRYGRTSQFPLMPITHLRFVPIYWIYTYVRFARSPLDYASFIRERNGLDYAEGMASNFFHGYLKLTVPDFTDNAGIGERINHYSAEHGVEFAVRKLVIIIPDTLYVSPVIESKHLEKVKQLECIRKNRAGVKRPYQNDVYRLKQPHNGRYYYIVLEGATPLVSFYDAMQFHPTSTWQMKEFERDILLKFYSVLKRLIKEWPEVSKQIELIFYATKTNDGRDQDIGDVLLAHFQQNRNATD